MTVLIYSRLIYFKSKQILKLYNVKLLKDPRINRLGSICYFIKNFNNPLQTINLVTILSLRCSPKSPNFLFFSWEVTITLLLALINIVNNVCIQNEHTFILNSVLSDFSCVNTK